MKEIASFDSFKLSQEIAKALHMLGYVQPTPVQQLVLKHYRLNSHSPEGKHQLSHNGQDICVKAKTGSGKTAAFGIPICERVDWNMNQPQALILVPTRELAVQVSEELNLIGKFKRLKVVTIFGKMSIAEQELSLKQKTHIVVGTPGRVYDLIQRGSLSVEELRTVVIDEADELFFIGLREQVESILTSIQTRHTTMLLSATLNDEVIELARKYMEQVTVLEVEETNEMIPSIDQSAIFVEGRNKEEVLDYILMDKNPDSCIVFANTQEAVDNIFKIMKAKGYPCQKLHGGMKQKERLRTMEQFKRKQFRYLLASDVAARGIDIKEVDLVINYDMAKGVENYTHRIGRTGRNGANGQAVTLYHEREEDRLKQMEEYTGQPINRVTLDYEKDWTTKEKELREKLKMKQKEVGKKGENLNREITRIHINAGKKSKIRTCEIVASICGIEGVVAEDIGVIEITETATFVEILNQKGALVLSELPKKTIKGRNRKVNKAKC